MNAHDQTHEHEPLWSAVETARYLKMSKSWVYRHTKSGQIPHARLGGVVRYSPERIRAYAEQLHAEAAGNVVSLADRRKGRR